MIQELSVTLMDPPSGPSINIFVHDHAHALLSSLKQLSRNQQGH